MEVVYMILGGLQKTTLVDYPGKIACTVFTVGCNFRCGFCHNRDLVTLKNFRTKRIQEYKEKEIFDFLKKRRGLLDGVCVTGGEPLIQREIERLVRKIKKMGFLVKIDTNGSRPEVLKGLIDKKLVDFVAMDIKTAFDKYQKAVSVKCQMSNVKSSIKMILRSGVDYELRTTVVPGLHDEKVLVKMAKELKKMARGKKIRWVWQNFRPKNCLDPKFLKIKPYSKGKFQEFLRVVRKILPGVKLRTYD